MSKTPGATYYAGVDADDRVESAAATLVSKQMRGEPFVDVPAASPRPHWIRRENSMGLGTQ